MRKLIYSVATSLDGYIAGPGGTLDWLLWSEDAAAISGQVWQGADTILMGRGTYEFAAKSADPDADPGGFTTFIFSRTMTQAPKGAELVRDGADRFVRALKAKAGGTIILMGGGVLAGFLVGHGLIDEIGLNVHPVLLGGGVPAFGNAVARPNMNLAEARVLAKGCAWLHYRLAR